MAPIQLSSKVRFQGVWLNLLILLLINIWFHDAATDLKTLFAQTFYECGGLMIAYSAEREQ